MAEIFTSTLNSTNTFEMKDQGNIENMGADEINFYNSIRADLDLIEMSPRISIIQNILNHSKNYVG